MANIVQCLRVGVQMAMVLGLCCAFAGVVFLLVAMASGLDEEWGLYATAGSLLAAAMFAFVGRILQVNADREEEERRIFLS